jgi:hypothetical protein
MRTLLRQFAVVLLLPVLSVAVLSLPVNAGGKPRYVYRVELAPNPAGGPVRATLEPAPASQRLIVISAEQLRVAQLETLICHFRNAERLAPLFAEREGLAVQRAGLPRRAELFDSPEGVAAVTGMPRFEAAGEAVARMDLNEGIVYLGRNCAEDVYAELGKWFFYEPRFVWGRSRGDDERHVRLIERFAGFCLDKKNWTQPAPRSGRAW